jgi:hypothetical protein
VIRDHSLKRLVPLIREIFKSVGWLTNLGSGEITTFNDLVDVVEQFEDVDPGSFAFRYPINRKLAGSVQSGFTFSVVEFSRRIEQVLLILQGASIGLAEEWDARAESAAYQAECGADRQYN